MAARLLGAGHEVTVWNRSPERAAALVDQGAVAAITPADAAARAELVVTMLSDPQALDDVVLGPEGIAAGVSSGAKLVEMSTVGPDAVRALGARLPYGVDM